MTPEQILNLIAGFLQLVVACYALRLNKLFGTTRAGWTLFAAFILMILLYSTRAWDESTGPPPLGFGPEIIYFFISLLLLLGMVHLEALFKARLQAEALTQNVNRELEVRVREKTAELAETNEILKEEIAERRSKQQSLEESEQNYRLLFGSNPHPMWVFDRESLAFLMVNNAAINHYGYSGEEFLGMTLKNILPTHDAPQFLGEVARISNQVQLGGTWRHLKKDGTEIEVEIATQELNLGKRAACLMLATNVTEKRRLEAQLRQAQKMEAIGQLAGGVAHDFNNLLTVMGGHAQVLLCRKKLDADTTDQLTQIVTAAQRASNLTRQLLTFSRKQIIQAKVVNLNEIVGDATKMLNRIIGEDITLQTNYSSHRSYIYADTGMIGQVLMNMAANARDAMPKGGRLVLSTRLEQVDSARARLYPEARCGEFVCLSVRDMGCGMTPEILSHIFEPFYTTKEAGRGTGLGLATTYGIVKQHGGWIEVTTAPNCGTEFKIFFPKTTRSDVMSAEKPVEPIARGHGETILVVEDEPAVRELVRRILQDHGYGVVEASSGVEALSVWDQRAQNIDLVLTDMILPQGMNGRELAARLRALRPELKIIFTSGYSPGHLGQDLSYLEGLDFLAKPYESRQLLQTIRERLDASA